MKYCIEFHKGRGRCHYMIPRNKWEPGFVAFYKWTVMNKRIVFYELDDVKAKEAMRRFMSAYPKDHAYLTLFLENGTRIPAKLFVDA